MGTWEAHHLNSWLTGGDCTHWGGRSLVLACTLQPLALRRHPYPVPSTGAGGAASGAWASPVPWPRRRLYLAQLNNDSAQLNNYLAHAGSASPRSHVSSATCIYVHERVCMCMCMYAWAYMHVYVVCAYVYGAI